MKKRDWIFSICFFLFIFTIWFFPKNIGSEKFLGFSDPLLIDEAKRK